MTEQEKADAGSKAWSPLIRLIIENPISAFNAAAIIFGGGVFYAQFGSYMKENDERIGRLEQQVREDRIETRAKDAANTIKFQEITRDLSDVKVTARGIEAAVQFLVQQAQQQQQNRRGPQ